MGNSKGHPHQGAASTTLSADLNFRFIAHPREDGDDQSVEAHLLGVAEKTRSRASKIGLGSQGELIGLLHDLGKYSKEFQDYIRSAAGRINPDETTMSMRKSTRARSIIPPPVPSWFGKFFRNMDSSARSSDKFSLYALPPIIPASSIVCPLITTVSAKTFLGAECTRKNEVLIWPRSPTMQISRYETDSVS